MIIGISQTVQLKYLDDECQVWVMAAELESASFNQQDPRVDQAPYLQLMSKTNRWHTIHDLIQAEYDVFGHVFVKRNGSPWR